MFLKTLEIFGFKSFADKVQIEFSDGVAALLGPDGCGKSNVVDAMKWVLGEQSSKSLRAENMVDVIFAGSETTQAPRVAEVTLLVSNQDEVLPLDLPEVAIKRRLYRSGESEYSINGQPVKLRDVRELFFDTGIGKSAYSIMEQGKIDQLLSTKPEERRYVFEEAAGITPIPRAAARRPSAKLEKTEGEHASRRGHPRGGAAQLYLVEGPGREGGEPTATCGSRSSRSSFRSSSSRLEGLLEDKKKREGRLGGEGEDRATR